MTDDYTSQDYLRFIKWVKKYYHEEYESILDINVKKFE